MISHDNIHAKHLLYVQAGENFPRPAPHDDQPFAYQGDPIRRLSRQHKIVSGDEDCCPRARALLND